MGTPQFVTPALHILHNMAIADVVAVVTPPDRPRGRGRLPEPPVVKEAARNLGIPVLQPASLRPELVRAELAELKPGVIVVAAYGRLLPPPVLALPPHGCLNIHPSLLPRHRGPSPVAAAILEGDEVTGVSLMLLDAGMDTGPVIARREHPVGRETAGDLTEVLFQLGAELLEEKLEPWTKGELQAQPQDDASATVTRKLERADGLADWRLPALTLERQFRAYFPWPGLYTEWQGKALKLLEVTSLPDGDGGEEPGRVVSVSRAAPAAVVTGGGLLGMVRVQLEGRRAVSADEFLRGYPDFIGACLGSQQTN